VERHTRHKQAIAPIRGAMADFSEIGVRRALREFNKARGRTGFSPETGAAPWQ